VATAYVDAQVRALCLVQSKAYPTQKALEAAYVQAEHSGKLSAHEFAQAVAATAHDVALRERISHQVAAVCGKR
jgi:predicted alternative tryptophan synthase beta-subunit